MKPDDGLNQPEAHSPESGGTEDSTDLKTPVKVLYIGGTGRSGSTVLDRLLGANEGWFSGGELAFLWRFGVQESGRCACGEELSQCPVWSEVFNRALGGHSRDTAARMVALRRRFWSVHLPLMVNRRINERFLDRLEEFPDTVAKVYRQVAAVTGSKVIVDSSKEPHYSYIMRERTDLDIYFLHLVRDPRAIGYSWQRKRVEKGLPGDQLMERRSPVIASTYFDVSNTAAEAMWRKFPDRYRFLRYEDLIRAPGVVLGEIGDFIGEPINASQVLDGRTFTPRPAHTAWGNPNRFDRAPTTLRDDEAWRDALSPRDAGMLSLLTAPLAYRYGYHLRQRSGPTTKPRQASLRPHTIQ